MVKQRNAQNESVQNGADGIGMLRMAVNWVIAGASLAAVGGFGYWAISLGNRNPNEVPIIRAMEGPARVIPDDPGGEQTPNKGLAVNTVESGGRVETPPERVVLAPQAERLAPEDLATAALVKPKPAPKTTAQLVSLTEAPEPVAKTEPVVKTAAVQPPAPVIHGTPYSPGRSLRPVIRPQRLRAQVSNIEPAVAHTAPTKTVQSVGSVPIGARLVQLGAYDSTALAEKQWDKLFAKHGDLLDGKKRLIQAAQSGGHKFYRLRAAGFDTREESRTLCSALLARGTPCIPVTAR